MNATKMRAKSHGTKAAFLTSLMSLILCFTMLVGTTFAWFTDTVTSGENQIIAGNLDIDVEYALPGENGTLGDWKSLQGSESLFSQGLWEPGHTEVVYLRVVNKGTLALNYTFNVSPISENPGTNVYNETFKLSDYLVFGTSAPAGTLTPYADRADARNAAGTTQKLDQAGLKKTGVLYANGDTNKPADGLTEAYTALVVYMPETVGNEANYLTGTEPPQIKLGVTVYATQKDHEEDSFGSDYDGGAVNSDEYTAGTATQYVETKQQTLTQTIVENTNASFESNVTPGLESDKKTTVEFPKEIKQLAENNGKEIDLEVAASPTVLANNSFTVGSDGAVAALTLNVTVDGTPVTQFENTDGEAQYVKVSTYVAKNMTNVSLSYGDSETWTQVDTEDDVTAGKFYYESATGKLVYTTNHFSTFIIGADEKVYVAEENKAYLTLEEVAGWEDHGYKTNTNSNTIYLLKDLDLTSHEAGSEYYFDLANDTLDLNGYTIKSNNNGVQYFGDGCTTIRNGKFECVDGGSYALFLSYSDGTINIEDITTVGGINCYDCDNVVINNMESVETAGTNYYAVWVEANSHVTIEDGYFSSPSTKGGYVFACTNNIGCSITINGGTFEAKGTAEMFNKGGSEIYVKGGTFNKTPEAFVSLPYETVENEGTWEVVPATCWKVTYSESGYEAIADFATFNEMNQSDCYYISTSENKGEYICCTDNTIKVFSNGTTASGYYNMVKKYPEWYGADFYKQSASVEKIAFFATETAANEFAGNYSGATVTKVN